MKPEAQLSASIYDMLRLAWKPKAVYFICPNSLVTHDPIHVHNMKRQGMTPGVADFIFLWWNGCGAIELKTGINKQTPAQEDFEQWCAREKIPYRIARSVEDFESILKEWGRI